MAELRIMNSKETKEFFGLVKAQWGFDAGENPYFEKFGFLKNSKDDIFMISRDISRVSNPKLKIDSAGLYFAEMKNGSVRLSIEGSQIMGKYAKKNTIELSRDECEAWMKGSDLENIGGRAEESSYLIVKYDNNFLGTGRLKEGRLLNFVPKIRRLKELC